MVQKKVLVWRGQREQSTGPWVLSLAGNQHNNQQQPVVQPVHQANNVFVMTSKESFIKHLHQYKTLIKACTDIQFFT